MLCQSRLSSLLFSCSVPHSVGSTHPAVCTERIRLLLGAITERSCPLSPQSCRGARAERHVAGSCSNERPSFRRPAPGSSQPTAWGSSGHGLSRSHGDFWLLRLTLGTSHWQVSCRARCGEVRLCLRAACLSLPTVKSCRRMLLAGALPKAGAALGPWTSNLCSYPWALTDRCSNAPDRQRSEPRAGGGHFGRFAARGKHRHKSVRSIWLQNQGEAVTCVLLSFHPSRRARQDHEL